MPRAGADAARLSVFKGREARLNKAIFHILALKGPLITYDIAKQIRQQKFMRRKLPSVVNRRVRVLERLGYVKKAGTKKTLPGSIGILYQISSKAYLALMLDQVSLNDIIEKTDETAALELLARIVSISDT